MMSQALESKASKLTAEVWDRDFLSASLDNSIKLITDFAQLKQKNSKVEVSSVDREEDREEDKEEGRLVEDRGSEEDSAKIEEELKLAVLGSYSYETPAEKKKICTFADKFNIAIKIITKQKEQLNYTESKIALDAALSAAEECRSIWEKIETGVSPIAYYGSKSENSTKESLNIRAGSFS